MEEVQNRTRKKSKADKKDEDSKVQTTKQKTKKKSKATIRKSTSKIEKAKSTKNKSTSSTTTKKTDTNTSEKEGKKYIDISVGAILCVVIIVELIILNVKLVTRAYNLMTKNQVENSDVETDNNIIKNNEKENETINKEQLMDKIKEKITFTPNATASIYDAAPFSANNVPNDLKLILGWEKIDDEKKLKSQDEEYQQLEAIEREIMEENIKTIFGPNVKYKDESFNNTKFTKFLTYSPNLGTITYNNGIYTSVVVGNMGTEISPIIYQEIQEVVKHTDKVSVYVKVVYFDVEENKYIAYKDFENEEFQERLLEITPEELFEEETFDRYTGEGSVTINTNASLNGIRNKLDTYVYIFSLNKETGEYYLSKLNKVSSK